MRATTYDDLIRRDRPLVWYQWQTGSTHNSGFNSNTTDHSVPSTQPSEAGVVGSPGSRALVIEGDTNAVTVGAVGIRNSAGALNASFSQAVSFEIWVKRSEGTGRTRLVFGRVSGPSTNLQVAGLWTVSNVLSLRVPGKVLTGPTLQLGQWYHIVGIFGLTGSVNNTLELWVNGQRVAVGELVSGNDAWRLISVYKVTLVGHSGYRLPESGTTARYNFQGSVAEPAIYGYALSPSQILDHYQVGLGMRRRSSIHTAFGFPFTSEVTPPPPPGGLTPITEGLPNRRVLLVSDRPR